jgi:DNA-binding NarL/FixJ family response regulator
MKYPHLVILESDRRLATELRELANKKHRWALRETRQCESCLRLLRQEGPAILVIKVGRDVEQEMALLEQVGLHSPDTAVVALCETENRTLADLIWDCGASYVFCSPYPRERLVELVERLMLSFPKRPLPLLPTADIEEEEKRL